MRSKQQTNTTAQSLGIITYRQVIHVQWSTNPLIFKLLLLFSGSDLDKAGPGRLGFWRWRSCLLVGGGSGVETPFWGSSSKKTRSSKTSCENKHREEKNMRIDNNNTRGTAALANTLLKILRGLWLFIFYFWLKWGHRPAEPRWRGGGGVYVLLVKSLQSLRCHNITANTSREAVNRARCCGFRDHSKMPERAFLSPYHPNT